MLTFGMDEKSLIYSFALFSKNKISENVCKQICNTIHVLQQLLDKAACYDNKNMSRLIFNSISLHYKNILHNM